MSPSCSSSSSDDEEEDLWIDARLEELADRLISQQGNELDVTCSGSVSAALAALLSEQAASPTSGSDGDSVSTVTLEELPFQN